MKQTTHSTPKRKANTGKTCVPKVCYLAEGAGRYPEGGERCILNAQAAHLITSSRKAVGVSREHHVDKLTTCMSRWACGMRIPKCHHGNIQTKLRHFSAGLPRIDRQAADIVPGDLAGTLEKHRASNRASLIRKLPNRFVPLQDRLELESRKRARRQAPGTSHVADTNSESATGSSVSKARRPLLLGKSSELLAIGSFVKPLQYRVKEPCRPYLDLDTSQPLSPHDFLDECIRRFDDWYTLSPQEHDARSRLSAEMQNLISAQNPKLSYREFGSQITGFASPTSDVDIRVFVPGLELDETKIGGAGEKKKKIQRKNACDAVRAVNLALKAHPDFFHVHLVLQARYPLVYLRHMSSHTIFQIVSKFSASPSADYVQMYALEFPQLRAIHNVVKATLDARGLMDPYTGGLGSYTLTVMIVAFLKKSSHTRSSGLGSVLLEFLHFYENFNTLHEGITADPPRKFKKSLNSKFEPKGVYDENLDYIRKTNPNMPFLLCLQDPADHLNDLGKGCLRIMDIRATFGGLRRLLQKWLDHQPERQKRPDPLEIFWYNMLQITRDRRQKLHEWMQSRTFAQTQHPGAKAEPSRSKSQLHNVEIDSTQDKSIKI